MIAYYARSLERDQRQNVLVEDGVVVKEYVVDGIFVWSGNPELIGQPEASLQVLGFEQVPGPLKRRWGSWVNITLEEMEKDEEERAKFHEEAVKEALKVVGTTIHVHVLKFHPILGKEDWFEIEEWHVTEGDIVQADKPLVTIECALGSFAVPCPSPSRQVPCGTSLRSGRSLHSSR